MNRTSHREMRRAPAVFALTFTLAVACLLVWSPVTASRAQQDRQLTQAGSPNVDTGKRIALVIGNGAYANAPPLKNPPNDARDMAETLKALGFDVTSGINANQREMKRLIREFGQKLKTGGSGLFYYAGHGVQSKGRNYLIPVDADIASEAEVEDSGVDVSLVLNFMDDAQNGLNIVILDACRNNPFARSFRSASSGLAQVDAPTGTLIAYATAPGRVASDGTGQNGIYTSELLKQMRVAGLSATEMFMHVRAEVMKQTNNKQVPWEASSLVGTFYFNAPTKNVGAPTGEVVNERKIDPSEFELSYWETIKNSTDPEDFKGYLARYPNGRFAELAERRGTVIANAEKKSPPATLKSGDAGVPIALNPQLAFTGQESYQVTGKTWIRYRLSVTNRAAFPNEMFWPAPKLPACGRNTNSSRTWVDIYDRAEKRLLSFCALKSSDDLANLFFYLPEGEAPPSHVFVVLTDRQTKAKYKSALIGIP